MTNRMKFLRHLLKLVNECKFIIVIEIFNWKLDSCKNEHIFVIDWCNLLGQGAHGVIYKGILTDNNHPVAIKTSRFSKIAFKQILSEIKILIYVGKHENILSIFGANTTDLRMGMDSASRNAQDSLS